MTQRSLRWRLVLSGIAAIMLALGLSALVLSLLFDRHIERVTLRELDSDLMTLAATGRAEGNEELNVPLLDHVYERPLSGRYWQMQMDGNIRRSRSLWDFDFPFDDSPPPPGSARTDHIDGPGGQPLLALERSFLIGPRNQHQQLRILVATDLQELRVARRAFLADLLPFLGSIGAFLILAAWAQIHFGLRPLSQIHQRVARLSSGQSERMGEDMPPELVPLAREIDRLLTMRDTEIAQARRRAADLAHGFKTPLQALLGDAQRLRDRGDPETATAIEDVAATMRRHVDRELARTRITASYRTHRVEPALIVQKIVRVLERTAMGSGVDWQIAAAPGETAQIDPDDLTEALGALLENAARFATTEVRIEVLAEGPNTRITIRDDGPGIPDQKIAAMIQRGTRLDQSDDGHGLGLSLAREFIEAADGSLQLRNLFPGLEVAIILKRGT